MYIACDDDFKAVFKLDRLRVSTLANHAKKHFQKTGKKEIQEGKPKKSGYGKSMWLSPELSEVMGFNKMPRLLYYLLR